MYGYISKDQSVLCWWFKLLGNTISLEVLGYKAENLTFAEFSTSQGKTWLAADWNPLTGSNVSCFCF